MRAKYPLVKFKKDENVWVSYTKQKVFRQNNSMNLVITGQTGSGKTYAMLSFFCLLNPDFELEGNFFFKAIDLMKALKDGNFKRGKIWGYDEAGIDANNLNYQNIIAKGLNALFQTARHRNYVFGLTLPHLHMLTKGVRTLMSAHWTSEGWNKKNQSIVVPRSLEYNGEVDKFYRKRLVVVNGNDVSLCNRILLPKPSSKLTREYEKLKKEYTQDLYEKIYKDMDAFDKKQNGFQNQFILTEREESVLNLLKSGKVVSDIKVSLGISQPRIYQLMGALAKKGVSIRGVYGVNNTLESYNVVDVRDKE